MSKKSDKQKASPKDDGKKKHDDGKKKKNAALKISEKDALKQPQTKVQKEVEGNGHLAKTDDGRLNRKEYEGELKKLQTELCHLQEWVKATGERVVIIFEGRDAAGKGGTIKAITERVSPRVFRLVALPAPSDREKTQLYVQRFVPHLPAAGEIVIFDRSWYNRAGVEHVMGFCTDEQYKKFLELCPMFEKTMVDNGIRLFKFWLEVSNEEQERRFEARIEDPLRQWKLSNMDLPSREKWYQYSKARDTMLECTDSEHAPWYLVDSNDKKRARLNLISHLLSAIPYKKIERKKVKLPDRSEKDKYDDSKKIKNRKWVPQKFK
ncbi:MAG: polyphosphate kinase 2 [Candidatus Melainabacteria bacterium]|nr:polyphosphate kinase 2 [Candidatus Melainabacteria bacterium]